MPTKTWTAKWLGHTIEVENWWGIGILYNRRRCRLFIDGECVEDFRGKGFLFGAGEGTFRKILRGQLHDSDGNPVVVRAEIHTSVVGFRMHCRIAVEDECLLDDDP